MTAVPGGLVITKEKVVIGAIGISGSKSDDVDEKIALEAIKEFAESGIESV